MQENNSTYLICTYNIKDSNNYNIYIFELNDMKNIKMKLID